MKFLIVPLCSKGVLPEEVERCVASIVDQTIHPFEYNVNVMCNTNDELYYKTVSLIGDRRGFKTFRSVSNGGNGKGHNAALDLFKSSYKKEGYTHLMMIDADDYYYPCAFEAIDSLLTVSPDADYMSNMQFADSVRKYNGYIRSSQPRLEISSGIWLHSNFNYRFPITPYVYWDGINCHGGEVTLFLSAKAVECNLVHLETPGIPDDYTHMLYALKAFVEGKLKFVNTDCNDIYVYDKTNPVGTTNQSNFKFSPAEWPAADRELICGPTFECLRNFTRYNIPWITIPQILYPNEKAEFILKNLIPSS